MTRGVRRCGVAAAEGGMCTTSVSPHVQRAFIDTDGLDLCIPEIPYDVRYELRRNRFADGCSVRLAAFEDKTCV